MTNLHAGKAAALAESPEWNLYISLTQFRLIITLHFILDLEHELSVVSKIFQRHDISPFDVIIAIARLEENLELLRSTHGKALAGFLSELEGDSYKGIRLDHQEEGRRLFGHDRDVIVNPTLMCVPMGCH